MARSLRKLLLTVAAVTLLAPLASADFSFEFGQAEYLVNPGDVVEVELYLVEDPGGGILATDGLISALTKLTFNEAPFAVDPAQVATVGINPGFDFNGDTDLTPATGSSVGTVELRPGVLLFPVTAPPATPDRILIATFSFVAGQAFGDVTSLKADLLDADASFENYVTGGTQPIVIDRLIRVGFSRIVTIPEPGSLALIGLGLPLGLLVVARRRRATRP